MRVVARAQSATSVYTRSRRVEMVVVWLALSVCVEALWCSGG